MRQEVVPLTLITNLMPKVDPSRFRIERVEKTTESGQTQRGFELTPLGVKQIGHQSVDGKHWAEELRRKKARENNRNKHIHGHR
jgi:hypothetical protein